MKARYSITGRLTTWFFLSACVLLISASTLLYWSLVQVIHRQDEIVLNGRIQTLQAVLLRPEGAIAAAQRRIESEWPQISPQKIYVRLRTPDGKDVSTTPAMPEEVLAEFLDKHPSTPMRSVLPSGKTYIAVSKHLNLHDGSDLIADVAIDLSDEETILPPFRTRLMVILLVELAVAFVIGRWLANASLSPVKKIAARASEIGPANLDERIAIEDLPEELLTLVTTFNEMLNRLSESFTRLSRFSSDIAHELRTPINNMRGEIEIALNKPRPPGEYEDVLLSALEEIQRITQITDALLFLAKSENPTTQLDRESCDLEIELQNVAEFFETISSEARVTLEVEAPKAMSIWANRTLLRQAIANLTSNAIAHTPPGGHVRLQGRKIKNGIEIQVHDTGEGIAAEHLPRVFDRFYRADPSRSSSSGAGSGLGLSIVQGIVKLHGGSIHILSQVGRETTVTMNFPDRRYNNP